METGKRHIKSGRIFDHLFSKPKGENLTIKKRATIGDTIKLMKKVVLGTKRQSKRIAKKLQGESVKKTCSNIWNFCFHHFQYEKDEERKEQVRTPSRSWWDRKQGIDCDCLTVFISSLLTNLKIPHFWRMTRYEAPSMEHIYPVAVLPNGQEVIIDCVVHKFDYEVPYTEKEDVMTELQVLNGIQQERFNEFGDRVLFENDLPIDAQALLLHENELDGLRDWIKRHRESKPQRKAERKQRREEFKKLPFKEKVKQGLKKGLNVINKVNPGAALLRAGVLASMKLNVFKVASHLRFSYWSAADAQRNRMDMRKFSQLQRIRQKIEKIYFGAGGKPEALKKAILTGKGNRNKMVALNGLGSVDYLPSDGDDLRTILGDDLYLDEAGELENEELNGFGAVGTSAAIGSASGLIAMIAAFIKKLGGLFKKGSPQAKQLLLQNAVDDKSEKSRLFSADRLKSLVMKQVNRQAPANNARDISVPEAFDETQAITEPFLSDEENYDFPDAGERVVGEDDSENQEEEKSDEKKEDEKGFTAWVKNNKLLAAGIGVAAVGGTILAVKAYNSSKAKKGLAGTPELSGAKRKKSKRKTTAKKRTTRRTKAKAKPRKKRSSIDTMELT